MENTTNAFTIGTFTLGDIVSYQNHAWKIIAINTEEQLLFLRNDTEHDTRWVRWENITSILPF